MWIVFKGWLFNALVNLKNSHRTEITREDNHILGIYMWNVENRQTDISFRNVSVNESENCRDRIVLWFDQNSHAMQCSATLWRKTEKTFCHQSATISSECTVLLMSGLDLVIKTCFNVQFCFRCGIWSQSWLTCFTLSF